jgi:periplasmic protein TonB
MDTPVNSPGVAQVLWPGRGPAPGGAGRFAGAHLPTGRAQRRAALAVTAIVHLLALACLLGLHVHGVPPERARPIEVDLIEPPRPHLPRVTPAAPATRVAPAPSAEPPVAAPRTARSSAAPEQPVVTPPLPVPATRASLEPVPARSEAIPPPAPAAPAAAPLAALAPATDVAPRPAAASGASPAPGVAAATSAGAAVGASALASAAGSSGAARGGPITPPTFDADYLHNPTPRYPPAAARLRESGRVLLSVLVSAAGQPERVELAASSGSPRLDQAALETVRRWRFVPARQGDQPVAATVTVPLVFRLDE